MKEFFMNVGAVLLTCMVIFAVGAAVGGWYLIFKHVRLVIV
jgi:hypothetical protein